MRILDVIHSLNPAHGGPAEGLRQSVLATRRLRHVEEVVTLDAPEDAWVQSFPAKVHALGPVRSTYGYAPHLVPWLRVHAPDHDAVVVHGLWQYHGLAVWRALHGSTVPYYVFAHGMLDPWFKRRYPLKHLKKLLYWPWAEYRVLRDARAVLFTAEEEARLAAQSFSLYSARPAVVGYGVDLPPQLRRTSAEPFLRTFRLQRQERLVLYLGRLHPKKGGDLLLDAFAEVAATEPALRLVMAGPDHAGYQQVLQQRAARLGIGQRITWTGMLQGELKWSALRAAEVFALPSHQENFGIAVAEALAMGLPVLVSYAVNIWREIVDAQAGFAAPDDAAGTLSSLRRWLQLSDVDRAEMRERAIDCYEDHFHMQAAARRLLDTLCPPGLAAQGAVLAR